MMINKTHQSLIHNILSCLYYAIVRTVKHDGIEHAGYMSFMILLSIFPFTVFLFSLSAVVGISDTGINFILMVIGSLPDNITNIVKKGINEIVKNPPPSILNLAIIGTIWTSSSFVEGLRTILNRIYEINSPPPYLLRRLLSILQLFLITIVIFFTMSLLIIMHKFTEFNHFINFYSQKWSYTRYALTCVMLFATVLLLYYLIPNIKIAFINIVPGAFITVFFWLIIGHLLSKYIVYYSQLSLVYGPLASIIITLLFFYLINIVFIYGAEFNYLMSQKNTLEESSKLLDDSSKK